MTGGHLDGLEMFDAAAADEDEAYARQMTRKLLRYKDTLPAEEGRAFHVFVDALLDDPARWRDVAGFVPSGDSPSERLSQGIIRAWEAQR